VALAAEDVLDAVEPAVVEGPYVSPTRLSHQLRRPTHPRSLSARLATATRSRRVLPPSLEGTAQWQQLVRAWAQHPENDNAILGTQLDDRAARIDGKTYPHRNLGVPFLLEQTR
jgi:hypothetical protein